MADLLSELRTVSRTGGDTYSSYEVIAMVRQAADEIERLRADMAEIASQCHNLPRSATADRIETLARRSATP